MKRITIILVLAVTTLLPASAQDVYEMVLNNATRVVNDPTSNFTQVRLAQFKKTALTYMRHKAEASDTLVSFQVLDMQAFYLHQFLTSFLRQVIAYSDNEQAGLRQGVVRLFIRCSEENPMWNDPDTTITQAYIGDNEELTPFSLDTNWEKAFQQSEVLLKQFNSTYP